MENNNRSIAYIEHSDTLQIQPAPINNKKSATVFVAQDTYRGYDNQRGDKNYVNYRTERTNYRNDEGLKEDYRLSTVQQYRGGRRNSDASSSDSRGRSYYLNDPRINDVSVKIDPRYDDAKVGRIRVKSDPRYDEGDADRTRYDEARTELMRAKGGFLPIDANAQRVRRPHSANELPIDTKVKVKVDDHGRRQEGHEENRRRDRDDYDRYRENERYEYDGRREKDSGMRGRSGYSQEVPINSQPVKANPESNVKWKKVDLSDTYNPTVWMRCGCCLCLL